MPRPTSKHPTELELEILKVIWRAGPKREMSGREVQSALSSAAGRELAYTSVVTILNIMTRKGYLRRAKAASQGSVYVYSPRVTEKATAGRMLRDLIDRVFKGSASAVVLKLLEEEQLDAAEIERLRQAVDRKAAESERK